MTIKNSYRVECDYKPRPGDSATETSYHLTNSHTKTGPEEDTPGLARNAALAMGWDLGPREIKFLSGGAGRDLTDYCPLHKIRDTIRCPECHEFMPGRHGPGCPRDWKG